MSFLCPKELDPAKEIHKNPAKTTAMTEDSAKNTAAKNPTKDISACDAKELSTDFKESTKRDLARIFAQKDERRLVLSLIKFFSLKPKKSMGQNYLCNEKAAKDIAEAGFRYYPYEKKAILETGPGFGALTRFLLEKDLPLTLVEKDEKSCEILKLRFLDAQARQNEDNGTNDETGPFKLYCGDILFFPIREYLKSIDSFRGKGLLNFSNLPYSLTSDYMEFLPVQCPLAAHILLLQKEAVDRLTAKMGTKAYGPLTVLTDLLFDKKKLFTLRPGAFHPRPGIESQLLLLLPKNYDSPQGAPFTDYESMAFKQIIDTSDFPESFLSFLKDSFANRRKILKNILLGKDYALEVLASDSEAMPFLNKRPESLSCWDFLKIYVKVHKSR